MKETTNRFPPRRILAATDMSPASSAALKYARRFAKLFRTQTAVVHAQHFDAPLYFTSGQVQAVADELRAARAAASARLAREAADLFGPGTGTLIVEKPPVEAILDAARDMDADLIVVGTHGRGGAGRLWLGSVAENVLRRSPVPVLAVRPSAPGGAVRRVLCPVGAGDGGRRALDYAASLARAMDAKLLLLHAAEPGAVGAYRPWRRGEFKDLCGVDETVASGDPARTILRVSGVKKADLVVMEAKRKASVLGGLFSSTTEQVMRVLDVPLLVVPGPGK